MLAARHHEVFIATIALLLLVAGCTAPVRVADAPAPITPPAMQSPPPQLGDEIAVRAIALVGKPYRYGGADLDGFDCSGMVYFIHQALGLTVPRTAAEQQAAARSIDSSALRPGDLVFFRTTRGPRISHVGIYVGDHRFVHAPQSGKLIELRSLDDRYYAPRLAGIGRFHPDS